MWLVILFCTALVLQGRFNVLVKSLYIDLGEDLEFRTHVNPTLTRKLVWPMLMFYPH